MIYPDGECVAMTFCGMNNTQFCQSMAAASGAIIATN